MTDTSGNPVANARLSVTQTNVISPLPAIYKVNSDNTITALPNPFLSDSTGQYVFAAGDGEYEIAATGSAAVLNISKTITDFTPSSGVPIVPVTLNRQVFMGSAAWTAPAGVIQAIVTCVGGGAGGQGGGITSQAGYGGGGGATVARTITVTPGLAYSIVIGPGGTGGSGAFPGLGLATNGTDTTFGTLVTAKGGVQNAPGVGTTAGYGGPIGLSVVADTSAMIFNGHGGVCSGGSAGTGGISAAGVSGNSVETYPGGTGGAYVSPKNAGGGGGGGATCFGAGANGGTNPTDAATGGAGASALANSGAGGGGGAAGATAGGTGGNGGSGLCIVEWIS